MPCERRPLCELHRCAVGALIEPPLPARGEVAPGEIRGAVIVEAILYVVCTDCSWRQLPGNFPPRPAVYWYFSR